MLIRISKRRNGEEVFLRMGSSRRCKQGVFTTLEEPLFLAHGAIFFPVSPTIDKQPIASYYPFMFCCVRANMSSLPEFERAIARTMHGHALPRCC